MIDVFGLEIAIRIDMRLPYEAKRLLDTPRSSVYVSHSRCGVH